MRQRPLAFQRRQLFGLTFLLLCLAIITVLGRSTAQSSAGESEVRRSSLEDGTASAGFSLQLIEFASGISRPVGIANAGDYRLFVLEQAGRIRIVEPDGRLVTAPFLDISDRVDSSDSEEGLLGLAFHPQYAMNGLFYVNYTNTSAGIRRTRISSFQVTANQHVADPASEIILLTVEQPYKNHNAGKIAFGPDGYLYIPLGDGGDGGDPDNNAQNPETLLGKISRIDVDEGPGANPDCVGLGSGQYAIPTSNPAVDGPGNACDEIWASGLRNPWQSSFDSLTGDLFIADVGQDTVEEINFQPVVSTGGENYGWRCYEGSEQFDTRGCDSAGAYTFPIFQYTHPPAYEECSVTGGTVYRGWRYPAMFGRYLLTDFCSGRFWDLQRLPDDSWQETEHTEVNIRGLGNTAFGERCDGELFLANLAAGAVYHVTAAAMASDDLLRQAVNELPNANNWAYLPLISTPSCR